jgi:hypothetical protein
MKPALRTNISALDTASRATMLRQLMKARRVSCCPLCAEVRQKVETADGAKLVCPLCGDVEMIQATRSEDR